MSRIRKIILRSLAAICWWLGIDALMYWLNKRAKRIITFHNVLPGSLMCGLPKIGCMDTLQDFERVVDEIGKRFGFSVNLNDPQTVTLTFDDGLVNQCEVAGESLLRRGIPAIMFVAGDVVDATPVDTLVTDKILLWNQFAPDDAVKAMFGVVVPRNELWVKFVQPAYRKDWQNRGRHFLSTLEQYCSVDSLLKSLPAEWVRLRFSGVSKAQLETLRQRGWKIGWHTKSHYPLGMLDQSARQDELSSPEEYRSVVLSYPYGDIGAIGVESLETAKELGYPCAVSNDPDWSPHRGRFFLQRMALSSNKYELHFVLSGLKYFIKHRKLLPHFTDLGL